MTSIAENRDCMEAMREFTDKFFDIAVVDPPYGGGAADADTHTHGGLQGGIGGYNGAIVGRFGGRFENYHLGGENRGDMGGEVQPARGCL